MTSDAVVRMKALTMAKLPCTNVSNATQTNCPKGFVTMDGNCYKALNISLNYWKASTLACGAYLATLLEFDNDTEVSGLKNLIKTGIKIMSVYFAVSSLQNIKIP
jgi:hypothetical protein